MHRSTLIAIALTVFGCSESNPGRTNASNGGNGGNNGSNGGTGGTSGNGGNADMGPMVDPNQPDPNCGVQDFMLQKGLPPDLLIVLDRSGSMDSDPGNGLGTKWVQITAALNQTVMALQGQIKWGLEIFPHDNDCGVSTSVDVAVAANNASAIATAIGATTPDGSTPTTAAIKAGTTYLQSLTDANPKYILIATDGEPNCSAGTGNPNMCTCPSPTVLMNGQCCLGPLCIPCPSNIPGGPDDAASVQAVLDANKAGIHTFVVGIAADSAADAVLTNMSSNGGVARPGSPNYFPVSSTMDLVNTVNTIAGQIISCSFALQMAPPHPDFVSVEVNMTPVPFDTTHSNGWDYGPNNLSIQFYGTWCDQLQTGNVTDVKAIYGCTPVS